MECIFVLEKGKRKNNLCGAKACSTVSDGPYCKRHILLINKRKNVESKQVSIRTCVRNQNLPTCHYIQCSNKVQSRKYDTCRYHIKVMATFIGQIDEILCSLSKNMSNIQRNCSRSVCKKWCNLMTYKKLSSLEIFAAWNGAYTRSCSALPLLEAGILPPLRQPCSVSLLKDIHKFIPSYTPAGHYCRALAEEWIWYNTTSLEVIKYLFEMSLIDKPDIPHERIEGLVKCSDRGFVCRKPHCVMCSFGRYSIVESFVDKKK